ncbi:MULTISPECIES: hypothetical protein [Mangrovimonas]|uniref:hypothetical protein n=1 Tax=Mangrovimonas TaxID=1211036 RepID=UPI0006B4D2EB|nr:MULTISPECIES: hypothetical protein [Mangrovimonas]WMI70059.1 hypothetical protein RBH95_06845 [Mangrovimonas sp. YM274]
MKETEICHYCGDDYIPKRKGQQKFCSNSCRSRNWQQKQGVPNLTPTAKETDLAPPKEDQKTKTEQMSWGGVANNIAGNMAYDTVKKIFTPKASEPATKKDIEDLKNLITNRYLPVNNVPKDHMGRTAFYDVQTGNVVFFLT